MPVGFFRLLSRLGDGHRALRSHFLCPLLEAARAYGGLALAVRWSGHIRPSRPSLRLFFRILFGYSRMRRPAREALNAGVVHAACNVCCLRGILSRM